MQSIIKLYRISSGNFNFSNSVDSLSFSYLLNRCQKVHLNGNISDPSNITGDVPQGLILGFLPFCMYINNLPDVLVGCRIHMYVDDVQLYTSYRRD